MKSVTVCVVVRVLSGGSAEFAESVLSIRRVRGAGAYREETPNLRALLLSRRNYVEYDAGEPSLQREAHRPRVN